MTGPRCTTAAPSRSLRTRSVRGARSLHPRPRSRAPPHDRRRHRLSLHRYNHRCILIEAQKADYPLALMCRLWGVPRGRAMFELLRLGRSGPRRRPCSPPGPCGSDQATFEASRQTSGWWWLTGCPTHRRLRARSDYHEIFLKDCKSLPGNNAVAASTSVPRSSLSSCTPIKYHDASH